MTVAVDEDVEISNDAGASTVRILMALQESLGFECVSQVQQVSCVVTDQFERGSGGSIDTGLVTSVPETGYGTLERIDVAIGVGGVERNAD